MAGGAVAEEVLLFDILAVVAFGTAEAEEALFEDGILAVPQR